MARILVVDADAETRLYSQSVLQELRHTVVTEDDGTAAIARYRLSPFDIIMVDLVLPGTLGGDAVKTLVSEGHDPARVIITSALSPWGLERALSTLPPVAVLQKPVDPDRLSHVVASMSGEAAASDDDVISLPGVQATSIELAPEQKHDTFGNYQLIRRLRMGGMAEVFLARRIAGPSEPVVIKKMSPDLADQPDFIDMFMDEARLSAILDHPNIVAVEDFGRVGSELFISMEFIDGFDLQTVGRSIDWDFSPELSCFVMAEVCAALGYAHRKTDPQGDHLYIVHRDVNPPNILISRGGRVLLTDFGIATAARRYSRGTDHGDLKGKYSYLSPEQVQGGIPVDHRADIFAVGVILYRLLTGQRPFQGKSSFETLRAIREAECPPPSHLNPALPEVLDEIVMAALRRDRTERYSDAETLEVRLREFIENQSVSAFEPRQALLDALLRAQGKLSASKQETRIESLPDLPPSALSILTSAGEDHTPINE